MLQIYLIQSLKDLKFHKKNTLYILHIQCVFNIIAVLRTNRVLHEICIDIKVSVSDFLRRDYEDLTR